MQAKRGKLKNPNTLSRKVEKIIRCNIFAFNVFNLIEIESLDPNK